MLRFKVRSLIIMFAVLEYKSLCWSSLRMICCRQTSATCTVDHSMSRQPQTTQTGHINEVMFPRDVDLQAVGIFSNPWTTLLAAISDQDSDDTPATSPWCEHLERHVPECLDSLQPLLQYLGSKTEVHDAIEVGATIARLLMSSVGQASSPSIDSLIASLRTEYQVSQTSEASFDRDAHRQGVFLILGWLCMLFNVTTNFGKPDKACIEVPDSLLALGVKKEASYRSIAEKPFGLALRSFGSLLPTPRYDHTRMEAKSEQVIAAGLSAYAMRFIGKVSFEWTDSLSSHLTFQPITRKLFLFRYPSFCAMNLRSRNHSAFDV